MKGRVAVRRVATSFAVLVAWAAPPVVSADSASPSATVEFLDGQTLKVDAPRFVYVWIPRGQRQFINPAKSRNESSDLHYKTLERGVAIEHVLPSRQIRRIDLKWVPSPPDQADLVALTVTTQDDRRFEIPASLFGESNVVSSTLVQQRPDPATFEELLLTGTATVSGQLGEFSGLLARPGVSRWILRLPKPGEVCDSCRPKSEVVKSVVFAPEQ